MINVVGNAITKGKGAVKDIIKKKKKSELTLFNSNDKEEEEEDDFKRVEISALEFDWIF